MNAALASAAVVVRRTIAASAEDLFDAWLDPAGAGAVDAPGTIQSTVARVEPRVGGSYEITMQAASGPILHKGVYRVIDRPRRLVFTWITRIHGKPGNAGHRRLHPRGQRTEVVVTHEQLPESAMPSHHKGLDQRPRASRRGVPAKVLSDRRSLHVQHLHHCLQMGAAARSRTGARPACALGAGRSRPGLQEKLLGVGEQNCARASRGAALWPGAGL